MAEVVIFTDVSHTSGWGRGAGAYKVATELRRSGYEVQVVDSFSTWKEEIFPLLRDLVDRHTLFVGFSTSLFVGPMRHPDPRIRWYLPERDFPYEPEFTAQVFATIRDRAPGCAVVVGGAKAEQLRELPADLWVTGQADRSAVAVANFLKHGTPLRTRPTAIVSSEDYPYREFAASQLEWHPSDCIFPGEILPLELSRGCIFSCAYCRFADLGKLPTEYVRRWDTVRAELVRNYEQFGVRGYMLCDDTVNDSLDKLRGLRDLVASLPFQVEFSGYFRHDVIWKHREMRELILECGFNGVFFGIETLNDEAGKRVGKGLGRARTLEVLHYLREAWKGKIATHGNFIFGLPGESEDSIRQTMEWLHSDPPLDSWIAYPLRLTNTQTVSKMETDPYKYGITQLGPGWYWKRDDFDYFRAEQLVRELFEDPRDRKSNPCCGFVGRFRNLGWSAAECLQLPSTPFREEARRRLRVQKAYRAALSAGAGARPSRLDEETG